MAKQLARNWLTSAIGVLVIIAHVTSSMITGADIDPTLISCGLGLLAASDGV